MRFVAICNKVTKKIVLRGYIMLYIQKHVKNAYKCICP